MFGLVCDKQTMQFCTVNGQFIKIHLKMITMTTFKQTITKYHPVLCVSMSYQSIVLCYQNEAIVVNEVAVNVL